MSTSTLNNWFTMHYSIPLDTVLSILTWNNFAKLRRNILISGRGKSNCATIIPFRPTLHLLYLVGATIGDGCLRHEKGKSYFESYFVSFEMSNARVMKLIQYSFYKTFGLERPIQLIRRKDGRKKLLLKYSNKVLYYYLQKFFGLKPRKSKSVEIKNINTFNKNQKLALLLGLCHTDGSLSKTKLRFYTSSERLKDNLLYLLTALGYLSTLYIYQRKGHSSEYQICVLNPKVLISELKSIEAELSRN